MCNLGKTLFLRFLESRYVLLIEKSDINIREKYTEISVRITRTFCYFSLEITLQICVNFILITHLNKRCFIFTLPQLLNIDITQGTFTQLSKAIR